MHHSTWRRLKLVKLKYKGEGETFFHYDGVMYKTQDKTIEVENPEAIKFILTNPKWESLGKIKIKKIEIKEEV